MIKVVFLASPKIALNSFEHLFASKEIDVIALVTQEDKPSGRGQKIAFSPLKQFAVDNNIQVFQTKSIRKDFEIQKKLKDLNPDFFVTFAFGQILSQEVLDIPKFATINLHVSLLPQYRGANPIQQAIIEGCSKTGICTMITVLELDAGDICLKEEIKIGENTNCVDLFEEVSAKAPKLIEETIFGLYNKTLKPKAQGKDGISFAPKLKKKDCKINWENSAKDLHNFVRGIYNFPSAYFKFGDKIIKIQETSFNLDEKTSKNCGEVLDISKEGIKVATKYGILLIKKVKPEGKPEMNAFAWSNGARIKIGDVFL